jgi:hypothetical protein
MPLSTANKPLIATNPPLHATNQPLITTNPQLNATISPWIATNPQLDTTNPQLHTTNPQKNKSFWHYRLPQFHKKLGTSAERWYQLSRGYKCRCWGPKRCTRRPLSRGPAVLPPRPSTGVPWARADSGARVTSNWFEHVRSMWVNSAIHWAGSDYLVALTGFQWVVIGCYRFW